MSQSPKQLLTANQLVPVNCQYEVAKATKKVELTKLPCPAASKIIVEILQCHSLHCALTASTSVPLIYMQQMWNTLQLADSKDKLKFTIDEEEVTFLMNDLRTILQLPQATDNDHVEFVDAPELGTLIKFLNILGHGIFYAIINNVHVDYAALIWKGLHYQLINPLTKNLVVPYPHFTKLTIDYILTTHHGISKRLIEPHQLVANDDVVQSIFASKTLRDEITIKRRQPNLEVPILTAEQIDIENMNKAQQLRYTLAKSAKEIDLGGDKERPEAMNVDYVVIVEEEECTKALLIRKKGKSSMELRDIAIATPIRFPRIDLSSDKEIQL
ncbi:hypothetical protein Tco_0801773 [Tanacetum coccineum]|uniref:Uncharacterized protein n=1 Tax=Tanacetum coccineum TaxID=301880 RepID=A0ABQ4ZXT7_9ASTR